jgi:hypothetical protein
MRGKIACIALLLLVLASIETLAAPRKLNVYMHRGKGAVSILDDADYRTAFKRIFSAHNLTIDLTSGRQAFLDKFFASDLVYLSLHSDPDEWKIASGELITVADLARAYREHGKKGPRLVIVSGCQTVREPGAMVSLPRAVGVDEDSTDRAYIGFRTITPGLFADRYFRVFLAEWLKTGPDGSHKTLEETRGAAKAFIERMLALDRSTLGKTARFAPADAMMAEGFWIIGSSELKVTDL